jgi:hypothetical protein
LIVACCVVDPDGGVVTPAEDEVADGGAVPARSADRRRVGGDSVVVEALVEGVGHFGGVAEQ